MIKWISTFFLLELELEQMCVMLVPYMHHLQPQQHNELNLLRGGDHVTLTT